MTMTLNGYQLRQESTAVYDTPMYPFGSIAEEAGEVMGKLNKYTRKNKVTYEEAIAHAKNPIGEVQINLRKALIAELGDVLWQVSAATGELGLELEDIARMNITKLQGRKSRGTLNGKGDDR